uniref:ATP synthase complex subunit 8 n=1 Tax=Acropoma japonicum TaxID=2233869 RepID=A0A7U1ARP6_9TELE|nr:ATP synthase F0 subunit 8 [Acropoma japonicum]QQY85679.1 ATP synthase F0 subunit 8 [Acropoma japonicum]
MPQLNPNPWLMILLFSWLVFLTVVPLKVMAHRFLNDPTSQSAKPVITAAWTWPWH